MPQTIKRGWTYPAYKLKPYFVDIASFFNQIDSDVDTLYTSIGSIESNITNIETDISNIENELSTAATTLDSAYDYGSPGGGREITADTGAVHITSVTHSDSALILTQEENNEALVIRNNGSHYAVGITGTGNKEIASDTDLIVTGSLDLFLKGRGYQTPLNETGELSLDGSFSASSIIGALNELKTAGGSGASLESAYNFTGAGAGRSITADSGAILFTVPVSGGNRVLELVQNDTYNPLLITNNSSASAIAISGTGTREVSSDANITISATLDLFLKGRGVQIPFNESGDTSLDGTFSAISVVGALNELKTAGGGGVTLDGAYDFGGAGTGRVIAADSGAVEINVPVSSGNSGLSVTQEDNVDAIVITNNGSGSALSIAGTGTREISSGVNLTLSATSDLFLKGRGSQTSLNQAGNTSLSGAFTATSIVGALNELKTAGGSVTLDGAYDFGGAGAGRSITADTGAVEITTSSNEGIIINQASASYSGLTVNRTATGSSIYITGTTPKITANGNSFIMESTSSSTGTHTMDIQCVNSSSGNVTLDISATSVSGSSQIDVSSQTVNIGDNTLTTTLLLQTKDDSYGLYFKAYGSQIPFNEVGDTALDGTFSATSIIGALNELKTTTPSLNATVVNVNSSTHSLGSGEDALHVSYSATGSCTITLTTAETVSGRTVDIKDTGFDCSTNNITIETEGSQLIEGESDAVLDVNRACITLQSNGTNWYVK